jgi:hypothetical protein
VNKEIDETQGKLKKMTVRDQNMLALNKYGGGVNYFKLVILRNYRHIIIKPFQDGKAALLQEKCTFIKEISICKGI